MDDRVKQFTEYRQKMNDRYRGIRPAPGYLVHNQAEVNARRRNISFERAESIPRPNLEVA